MPLLSSVLGLLHKRKPNPQSQSPTRTEKLENGTSVVCSVSGMFTLTSCLYDWGVADGGVTLPDCLGCWVAGGGGVGCWSVADGGVALPRWLVGVCCWLHTR